MIPYLLILLLPLAWLQALRSYAPGRILSLLVPALLVTFVGLRHHVGGDWHSYVTMYDNAVRYSFRDAIAVNDSGYMFLNVVAARLNTGVWLVNLVCAAIFVCGLTLFCQRLPFPSLALLISIPVLVVVCAMGFTRQAAALGLLLAAYRLFEERRGWLALLLAGVAISVHWSGAFFLPLVLLLALGRGLTIPWTFALGAMGAAIVLVVEANIPNVADYIEKSGIAHAAAFRLVPSVAACALYLYKGEFGLNATQRTAMRYMIAMTFSCVLLLPIFPTISDRIGLYLVPAQMVGLTAFVASFPQDQRARRTSTICIAAVYITFYIGWMLNSRSFGFWWFPYDNYLLQMAL
ncbi:MAG TPA: EpsG family protein [Allosphingosinicella sp.]|jgi:hypothetical protein